MMEDEAETEYWDDTDDEFRQRVIVERLNSVVFLLSMQVAVNTLAAGTRYGDESNPLDKVISLFQNYKVQLPIARRDSS